MRTYTLQSICFKTQFHQSQAVESITRNLRDVIVLQIQSDKPVKTFERFLRYLFQLGGHQAETFQVRLQRSQRIVVQLFDIGLRYLDVAYRRRIRKYVFRQLGLKLNKIYIATKILYFKKITIPLSGSYTDSDCTGAVTTSSNILSVCAVAAGHSKQMPFSKLQQ